MSLIGSQQKNTQYTVYVCLCFCIVHESWSVVYNTVVH